MQYTKHYTTGEIIDFFIKSFGIEKNNDSDRKRHQRFVSNLKISSSEYEEQIDFLLEEILLEFFEEKKAAFLHKKMKAFFHFYHRQVIMKKEPLNASKKQLLHILLKHHLLPLMAMNFVLLGKKYLKLYEVIDNDKSNAIKSLFIWLRDSLQEDELRFKNRIIELFHTEARDKRSDETIRQDIDNWLSGTNAPLSDNIKILSILSDKMEDFSRQELYNFFSLAVLTQKAYSTSLELFGKAHTAKLEMHFGLIQFFYRKYLSFEKRFDKDSVSNWRDIYPRFTELLQTEYTLEYAPLLREYLEGYMYNNLEIISFYEGFQTWQTAHLATIEKVFIKQKNHHELAYLLPEDKYFYFQDYYFPVEIVENVIDLVYKGQGYMRILSSLLRDKKEKEAFAFDQKIQLIMQELFTKDDRLRKHYDILENELRTIEVKQPYSITPLQWIQQYNLISVQEQRIDYLRIMLYLLSMPENQKPSPYKQIFKEVLETLKIAFPEYINDPYTSFILGRFYAQEKDFKKAHEYYEFAFENGLGKIGELIRYVIEEGLIVYAQTTRSRSIDLSIPNNKSPIAQYLKQVKKHDLLEMYVDDNNLIVRDYKQKFDSYFMNLWED